MKKTKEPPMELVEANTDIIGLSEREVQEQKFLGNVNITERKCSKSYKEIFLSNIFTFFNMLLLAIGAGLCVIYAITGQSFLVKFTKFGFLTNVFINAAIAIFQEIKAKKTLEKLSIVTESEYEVYRNGNKYRTTSAELVKGDFIELKQGQQIPVDGILISGNIEANESLLTGESDAIQKTVDSSVLAGSFVVSGKCIIHAENVGKSTYASSIQNRAKDFKKVKSELMTSIGKIIKALTIIIIPIGIGMFCKCYFGGDESTLGKVMESAEKTAAVMVGEIPSGMILLTSVSLACGIIKLSRKNTLVQDLYSMEMLARVDVLCLDKTGTLTNGRMNVEKVLNIGKSQNINSVIKAFQEALPDKNQTSLAICEHFWDVKPDALLKPKEVLPFSSERKMSMVKFSSNKVYIQGAPEYITSDNNILKIVNEYATDGYRVVLFAEYLGNIEKKNISERKVRPLFLIILKDQVRKTARASMEWFKNNGVEVKIISGDNPATVSKIAEEAGVEDADRFIAMNGIHDEDIERIVGKYNVFGRVSPEQKAAIIKAFQREGKRVAFVGDGVNDVLPLKTSDCSIAMAEATDAAKSVSNVVLLDSDFSNLPKVVDEGRRVINNVTRTSTVFLMKTLAIMLSALLTFCWPNQSFLLDVESLWITETFVIGMAGFLLSIEPSSTKLKGKFIQNVASLALPAGLFLFSGLFVSLLLQETGLLPGISGPDWLDERLILGTMMFISAGLIVLIRISIPANNYRFFVVLVTVILSLVSVLLIPDICLNPSSETTIFLEGPKLNMEHIFNLKTSCLSKLEVVDWIYLGAFVILGTPIYFSLDRAFHRLFKTER